MKDIAGHALRLLVVGATAVVLMQVVRPEIPAEPLSSGYVERNGLRETGALNLVTSIYLGYRAFDTLGETIVLFLAVSGVIHFIGKRL